VCCVLTRRTKVVSCAAGKSHSLALVSDGTLFTWGDGQHGQLGHPHLTNLYGWQHPDDMLLLQPMRLQELAPSSLPAVQR
jgi:alpha-tubulin suppressor-like RCC1 family protein